MGASWVRAIGLACALAGLLAVPLCAWGGEIRWLTQDDADHTTWTAAADLVWRGEPIAFERLGDVWPPRPEVGEAGADLWHCWLLEETDTAPVLVVAPVGSDEHLHVPLQAEGLSRDEVVRAALLLTQSMRRSIQIADGGWMPAADLASLFGGDLRPAVEVDDAAPREDGPEVPEEPVEEVVEEVPVEPPSLRRAVTPHLGLGVGTALRPADEAATLAPSARVAFLVGSWIGPGASVGFDVLGERAQDSYRVGLTRVLIAGRWQVTPGAGRWLFPVSLGLGAGITTAHLVEPDLDSSGTVAPPVGLAGAGAQVRLGSWISLARAVDATVDLMAVRIAVEGPDPRVEVDLHVFTLSPRLEVVFHTPVR